MAQNVLFKIGTRAQFDAIVTKSETTLYWLTDTQELYKGNVLFGTGAFASETAAGLLSAEDYKKLKDLIVTGGTVDLIPVNGSIVIEDKKIGIGLSAVEGNMLSIEDDGLFVPAVDMSGVENRLVAVEGSISKLQEDILGGIRYKGAVETTNDLPADAKQGDLYEVTADGSEWCYNGEEWFEYGSAHFVPVAGDGIQINGNEIAIKIADNAHGLVAVDGGLSIVLATDENDGAMSKEDKAFINSIPHAYVAKKYEVTEAPEGTLVNYYEKEIRIMCPKNAEYNPQNVGAGGDKNSYYVTLNTFAPDGAVGYVEHLGGQVDAEILKDIKIDKYGRRYQPTWLAVAKNSAESGWSYYGANSTASKYIGWDYQIDWYNADGVMISSDSIRINLSNEDCHFTSEPYYMAGYADEVEDLKATITELEQSYSWGEM